MDWVRSDLSLNRHFEEMIEFPSILTKYKHTHVI